MEKYYNSLSFTDYPPTELLDSHIYMDSIKRLSFQYRTKNEDELIAYIALSQESPNLVVPNINNQTKGCRILGIGVKSYNVNNYQVIDLPLLIALLEEAEFYIMGWVDRNNCQFQCDYIWYYISDIVSSDIRERIGGIQITDEIMYKIINRNEQPNQ